MAESRNQEKENGKNKQESVGKFLESPTKSHVGTTCSVCHKVPAHSRTYYGHLFCIECFHKYIWSPAKGSVTCSGDIKNQLDETCEFLMNEEGTSK